MDKTVAVKILLNDLKQAHAYLEQTIEGVNNDIAAFMPEGKDNPIAGVYAHLIFF